MNGNKPVIEPKLFTEQNRTEPTEPGRIKQDFMSPEFSECLTKAIAEDLAKKESEANKSMRMLEMVGDRARNYTCADPEMDTTNTSLSKISWLDPEGGITYNAQVSRARQSLGGMEMRGHRV